MITPFFIDVPCRCGRRHHVPLDPNGRVQFVCGSLRKVVSFSLNARQFQQAMLRTTSEQLLTHEEGVCVVHRAAAPKHDQQRCADCGWLLVSYGFFLGTLFSVPLIVGRRRDNVQFWDVDARVGWTVRGDYYLASEPLTPHRERTCFLKVA